MQRRRELRGILLVCALLASGVFSSPARADATPSPPLLHVATAISYSEVDLGWYGTGADSFTIERDSGSGFEEVATVAAPKIPVAIGGKTSVVLNGSAATNNICSYDSSATDPTAKTCVPALETPIIGTSGTISCLGPSWTEVPVMLFPPAASSSGGCANTTSAPRPYPWYTPTTPPDALSCPGEIVGGIPTLTVTTTLIPGAKYACTDLRIGRNLSDNAYDMICLPYPEFSTSAAVEFYVSGSLRIGKNARVNIGSSVGGCPGTPMGPSLSVFGGSLYYPTNQSGAFRVFGTGGGAVYLEGGSGAPLSAATYYAPGMSSEDVAGGLQHFVFGSVMLNNYRAIGQVRMIAHDIGAPDGNVTFTDSGLEPYTTYVYRIRSIIDGEESEPSNELTVTTLASLSGRIIGGTYGSISVYSSAGYLVAYGCCMVDEFWQANVPTSSCPEGGYRVLWLPPDDSKAPTWIGEVGTFFEADCISAPSVDNNASALQVGHLSGYVKDFDTSADIDGAVAYAFTSSGSFAGWSMTGSDGPGRFRIAVPSGGPYKVRVVPPTGYVGGWYSASSNWTEATAVTAPDASVNFSVPAAGVINGYVKDGATSMDLNGHPVYAYSPLGQFLGYGVTDRGHGPGRYRIDLPPGDYKLLAGGGSAYANQWYSGAGHFVEATAVSTPATANFSLS